MKALGKTTEKKLTPRQLKTKKAMEELRILGKELTLKGLKPINNNDYL
jgi:hypothetical protein